MKRASRWAKVALKKSHPNLDCRRVDDERDASAPAGDRGAAAEETVHAGALGGNDERPQVRIA